MKKLFSIILMAAVVFAACTKENTPVTDQTVTDRIVTINATIAGDTKVALGEEDEKKVNWTDGDKIKLTISGTEYEFTWEEGTTFAYEGNDLPALEQGTVITATYASTYDITQTGLKADVGNYMALSAETTVEEGENYGDLNLTFSHGTSVLKLTLSNDAFKGAEVTDITVKAGAAVVATATETFTGDDENGSVTAYLAIQPAALENVTIYATCDSKEYIATISDNTLVSGKIYTADKDVTIAYKDEYGVNHGNGVNIDGVIWAPVNCGYEAPIVEDGNIIYKGYPYGKLYQWGRKYGQGYNSNDAKTPDISNGGVSLQDGQSEGNKNVYFKYSEDWLSTKNNGLWNSGTETSPVKTVYDPCPNGWRVPTKAELSGLCQHYSSSATNAAGQRGFWLSGLTAYSSDVAQVFFPVAGYHHYQADPQGRDNRGGYWSSMANPGDNSAYNLSIEIGNGFTGFDNAEMTYGDFRAIGLSVRCVQE